MMAPPGDGKRVFIWRDLARESRPWRYRSTCIDDREYGGWSYIKGSEWLQSDRLPSTYKLLVSHRESDQCKTGSYTSNRLYRCCLRYDRLLIIVSRWSPQWVTISRGPRSDLIKTIYFHFLNGSKLDPRKYTNRAQMLRLHVNIICEYVRYRVAGGPVGRFCEE